VETVAEPIPLADALQAAFPSVPVPQDVASSPAGTDRLALAAPAGTLEDALAASPAGIPLTANRPLPAAPKSLRLLYLPGGTLVALGVGRPAPRQVAQASGTQPGQASDCAADVLLLATASRPDGVMEAPALGESWMSSLGRQVAGKPAKVRVGHIGLDPLACRRT
jgi:hypothetical protein